MSMGVPGYLRSLLGPILPSETVDSDLQELTWSQIWLVSSHMLASGFQGTNANGQVTQCHPFPDPEKLLR